MYGLTPGELRTLRGLDTAVKVQRFLDGLTYNREPGGATCRSPAARWRCRRASTFATVAASVCFTDSPRAFSARSACVAAAPAAAGGDGS